MLYLHIYIFYGGLPSWAINVMKKNRLFSIFSTKSEDKEKSAIVYTDFKGFFISLGRKFWNLSNLNLLFVLANFPILFFLFIPTITTHVLLCIGLITIITYGLSNAGMAYVVRAYNRAEPVFMFSDFFGAVKRNVRQAIVIGVLDIVFTALLVCDVIFWSAQSGFVNGLFFYFSLFLFVLYFIMRFYIYTLMITFKLSVFKIFKNAFIFAFLGVKRNIVGLLGIAVVIALNIILFGLFPPVGIALPFIISTSLCYFIGGYTSYPVIKQYMIDPYYNDDTEDKTDDDGEEPVFVDRG